MPVTNKLPNHLFFRLDANYRAYFALFIGVITFLFTHKQFNSAEVALFTWLGFALAVIIMDWIIILKAHPREIRKIAKLEDSNRTMIFLFVIVASIISLGAILFLLKSTRGHGQPEVTAHILLAMASVIVSWWLVHTLFTMRYAHLYYDVNADNGDKKPYGGLEFPKTTDPDYLDFVYFSFVIGMTFQVSDVEISDKYIRRLAWIHGLIAFAFNTAIVALSINIISSLV